MAKASSKKKEPKKAPAKPKVKPPLVDNNLKVKSDEENCVPGEIIGADGCIPCAINE